MLFKASAPGSLMLLGEYGVLHNKLAIVCAVDKRITVELTPRDDTTITISSALGEMTTQLSNITIEKPFQFVLATLKKFQNKMNTGCDIKITSEFSDTIGFASSAAVTVATVSVLLKWLKTAITKQQLVKIARNIVLDVQGIGSGADVAACVFGGIIAYRARPLKIEPLHSRYPLTVIYSGSKTPTTKAIAHVKNNFTDHEQLFKKICETIDHCANLGKQAIQEQNWIKLGKIMNIQQGLLDSLGVNTPTLNTLINELRDQSTILGAKITGSGLGDCVIGLGEVNSQLNQIPIQIAEQGVVCE